MSLSSIDPMFMISGTNISPDNRGNCNLANFFQSGSNMQNTGTIRTSTISCGTITGIASGTHSALQVTLQSSTMCVLQGQFATRLTDMGMANCNNAVSTQVVPGHTKEVINR